VSYPSYHPIHQILIVQPMSTLRRKCEQIQKVRSPFSSFVQSLTINITVYKKKVRRLVRRSAEEAFDWFPNCALIEHFITRIFLTHSLFRPSHVLVACRAFITKSNLVTYTGPKDKSRVTRRESSYSESEVAVLCHCCIIITLTCIAVHSMSQADLKGKASVYTKR
jgi:hypothetical protein